MSNFIVDPKQVNTHLNEGLTDVQVQLKRERIQELLKHPYRTCQPSTTFVPVNSSLDEFICGVKRLMDMNQVDKKNKVIFVDDFTKGNIFEDPEDPGADVVATVAYRLRRRAPGTTAGGNTPFDKSRREMTPHIRAITVDDIENPRETTFHMGQWFDNELRFEIYARTNKEANEIAMWFETLMDQNKHFFASHGIMKYYFQERESDTVVKEGDGVVHCRPLCYWVRTEKCFEITEQAINNIVILLTTI